MKVGYYQRGDIDMVSETISRFKEVEGSNIIKVSGLEDIPIDGLDYFIFGGAPFSYVSYWKRLQKISRQLPKTKFIMWATSVCPPSEVKQVLRDRKNLECLELDPFSNKMNYLIDNAK